MGMATNGIDKEAIHELCDDAIAMCNSLDIALIGVQSRLELELPVSATMKIIEWDLQALDRRIEALQKAVPEDEEI